MAFRATARLYKAAAGAATSAGGHAPYGGFHPHVPGPNSVYVRVATGVQALMWFWVFHRAKEDGAVVLVRASRGALPFLCAVARKWPALGATGPCAGPLRAAQRRVAASAGTACERSGRPRRAARGPLPGRGGTERRLANYNRVLLPLGGSVHLGNPL